MRSLRSIGRSPLALALLLLASLAQQVGAVSHAVMAAWAGMPAGMLEEVCTSAGLARVPGAPEPTQSPTSAGGICDLCASATMASLLAAPANAYAIALACREGPTFAPVLPRASPLPRAHRSRAPPDFLPA